MSSVTPLSKAESYLHELSLEIANRRVGSPGNRKATDFFATAIARFGFETDCPEFDCIDWQQEGAQLSVGDQTFEALVSPYSLGGQFQAPLTVVSTVEALDTVDLRQKILLVRGELAKEQLMPKKFPFYNPEHHQRIIHLLETKKPQAIIAATTKDVDLAGAVYPFPLIEDGDFDIPSVYITDTEGNRLADQAGREITLDIRAERFPATGCNVVARKGTDPHCRVVLFAHIDAKDGTPGAIDNAAGVVVLLLLAELLADYSGRLGFEIVALNGEDYYDASGEKLYVKHNEGKFAEIVLGINLDGLGFHQGRTAYSLYDCPPDMAGLAHHLFSRYEGMVEGEAWYQSDHGLFLLNQRPALAITSERFTDIWTKIAHTPRDKPEIVDCHKLVEAALALRDLLLNLDELMS